MVMTWQHDCSGGENLVKSTRSHRSRARVLSFFKPFHQCHHHSDALSPTPVNSLHSLSSGLVEEKSQDDAVVLNEVGNVRRGSVVDQPHATSHVLQEMPQDWHGKAFRSDLAS